MDERLLPPVVLTPRQLDDLPEYSSSIPTGTTIGKKWKCKVNYYDESQGWLLMEYTEHPDPDLVNIKAREVIVRAE